jgi:hypothetical protein
MELGAYIMTTEPISKLYFADHFQLPCVSAYRVTGRKVEGSRPDEVNEFVQFTSSFQPHYGPGVYSASGTNEYQKHINNNVSGEHSAAGA